MLSYRRFFVALLSLFVLSSPLIGRAQAEDLKVTDLVVGTGAEARAGEKIAVHYTGWLMNGSKFDSSLDRGQPFEFQLGAGRVIPGWDKGVEGMKVGGKRELIIPAELAYGSRGAGGVIPPNATLKFEVELMAVVETKYKNVNLSELEDLIKRGVKVVDVRTQEEWNETGVIKGAEKLPFVLPGVGINPDFMVEMQKLAQPGDEIALICRSGNRSTAAAEMLSNYAGFTKIYNATPGMMGWVNDNREVVKP